MTKKPMDYAKLRAKGEAKVKAMMVASLTAASEPDDVIDMVRDAATRANAQLEKAGDCRRVSVVVGKAPMFE